jgi:hypothetical protein
MSSLLLLDVRPEPVPVAGPAGLILLVVVVLVASSASVVAFVYLLKRLKRRKAEHGRMRDTGFAGEVSQPSKPNQL